MYKKITFKKINILILMFVVPLLMGMGVDLYVPSLPAITQYFNTKINLVQLTISLYMLGYGVGQSFLGFISDAIGRRKMLLTCCFFYAVISIFVINSPNVLMLNIYRFMQGIGIAGLAVITRAIIVDCFAGKELAKTANYFVISWTIGPIIGPFIGGYLQHYFNWKADFYFFCVYSFIVYLFILFCIPETNRNRSALHFGAIYKSAKSIIFNRQFFYLTTAASLGYGIIVAFNVVGPFLIQTILHYSAVDYGYIALALGVAYFLGTSCNRMAMKYLESIQLFLFGIISLVSSSMFMIVLSLIFPLKLIVVLFPALLVFILCGFVVPNGSATTLVLFPKQGGAASSIFGFIAGTTVFIITSFASLLKTTTQLPLAFTYFGLSLVALLFLFVGRIKYYYQGASYEKQNN